MKLVLTKEPVESTNAIRYGASGAISPRPIKTQAYGVVDSIGYSVPVKIGTASLKRPKHTRMRTIYLLKEIHLQ
jgi:hypothetical protein